MGGLFCLFLKLVVDREFDNIYNEYRLRLCLYAYRIVNSVDDAQDIVQTVFLNIYEKDKTLAHVSSFKPYVYRAVHNACINFIKKNRESVVYDIDANPNLYVSEDEEYLLKRIEDELLWELLQAVEALPGKSKKIFKMSYVQKLSNKEIAQALNISVNTVKSQKQRAKKLLREQLKNLFPLLMLYLNNSNIHPF